MIVVILSTLTPVFGLILLGALLRHIGFLHAEMEAALNRFAYWIALPTFIVVKVASAPGINPASVQTTLVLMLTTATLILAGILAAWALRIPGSSRGSFIQAGFRGNLAYIGIPVIGYALSEQPEPLQQGGETLAVLSMTPLVLVYNLLAVMALEWDRRHDQQQHPIRNWLRSTVRNPLIIACVIGLIWNSAQVPVPSLLRKMTDPIGATAFPLALIAIGARIRSLSWRHARKGMIGTCLVKNAVGVLSAWGIGALLGLEGVAMLVVLVMGATPSAIASYVLVDQLNGDRDLTAAAIAGSTIASIASLAAALWIYFTHYAL